MALTDMTLTKSEAKQEMKMDTEGPRFPWGLELSLDAEALGKLGITSMPDVGTNMTLTATVNVTRVSSYQNASGSDNSTGLQITAMELAAPMDTTKVADKLFGKKEG